MGPLNQGSIRLLWIPWALELHSLELLNPLSTGESRFVGRFYSGLLLGSLAQLDGQSCLGGACLFLGDLSDAVL